MTYLSRQIIKYKENIYLVENRQPNINELFFVNEEDNLYFCYLSPIIITTPPSIIDILDVPAEQCYLSSLVVGLNEHEYFYIDLSSTTKNKKYHLPTDFFTVIDTIK